MVSGMGRPKARLRPAKETLTKQVRFLIDQIHEGNIREASEASGLPYATLRDLYTGRTTNPVMKTLSQLGHSYGIMPDWFIAEPRRTAIPSSGVVVKVRETNSAGQLRVRGILLPHAAWPLPWVFRKLEAQLDLPAPERPMLKSIDQQEERAYLLAEFLLRPLTDAEALGLIDPLPDIMVSPAQRGEAYDRSVSRMRALGKFWREALASELLHASNLKA